MCGKCSPLGHTVWLLANLITALAAIHIGLLSFGMNILHGPFIQMRLHYLIRPIDIIVGLSGLYILLSSLYWSFKGSNCSCD